MRAFPVVDNGKMRGVVEIVSDITEQKRVEEAMRVAREELECRVRERTRQLTSVTSELYLAEERERRRIATQLHDQVGQTLIMNKIRLDTLSPEVPRGELKKVVSDISKDMAAAIEDIRSLTFQLSPPLLYEIGFEAAMEWLGEEFALKHGFGVNFFADKATKPVDEETGIALYQMVRELLVNVARHAKAKTVTISVERIDHSIRITVADDGTGFECNTGTPHDKKKRCFGLFNIRQRIEYLGGKLETLSETKQGTQVTLTLPLQERKRTRKTHCKK
jgi:signal transduction histidine kinase